MQQPLKQKKLSDIILVQLENMILEGGLLPGEKLLPERELAKKFDVSRPSLREAVQKLEAKGLVTRKQGGGTFVSKAIMKSFSDPLFDLMAENNESQFDLLEFRHGIEGMASYYAAMRGTSADFENIQAKHDNIGNCQLENDYSIEANAVYEFYVAICTASHNAVILHTARSMSALLIDNIERNLTMLAKRPDIFSKITDYRRNLLDAITSGQPKKAWGASHRHLAFIEEVLLKLTHEHSRMERSMRRM
ncbi:pyruvate dehydrogenase complex transcriptional repressor PdhR [Colwellia sp. 4_MG-2023]|jgi:GntR family transcriptional repressor for pyruvate dehydrogenase complex|uniref:pyruvate dehydrogenase complex transcriptional repressor PdhR n=1 Tax=unclassified Colwellia TaxID=196834 RepID=UPI001C0853AD|nr:MULTISPECIES: pyruvate dehydrogenase complex transcriptional repressor PdhR [unclassified Colwellia]MBU2925389.1 pyruvate dehydrogenase complex transcriptional repressor PdhR [Colwellia sp. C2M11]MDO6489491.1 pyruvate dehydrogenase complex transcriptional repressor PdhR [Colwellia sp. 6_MG-2023]MDO6506028.1 pyruvate dehydrogenase complex transcriptional repressor PdhR [Colwellia sp. 5_MG-2023]MDO6554912.1 pyruvate dehydrogenase complex transcriptional repressor PdhR [Colwellia sp. 4_MG-2023]